LGLKNPLLTNQRGFSFNNPIMQQVLSTGAEKYMQGLSLIIAPLLLLVSGFFWEKGEYKVAGATFLILSLFFWIPALTGLFGLVKTKMPRYAVYGLWIAVYGCISGVCFGFLGYLTTIFNISHQEYLSALSRYPISSQLLLFLGGPLFPLSILLLGINLVRTKSVKQWAGILLCLASIAFPLSRIPRIELIAHAADILFLIPCLHMGIAFFQQKDKLN